MALERTEAVTTRPLSPDGPTQVPQSEILLNGSPTGKQVSGAVLEAAIRWGNFYLLLMTDDVPHEDMLGIHLFDRHFNLIDSATLGGIYTTGSFSSLELIEPNRLGFRFIGDTLWEVELLSKPALHVPFFSDPKGVHRKLGFSKHFRVFGKPAPETS